MDQTGDRQLYRSLLKDYEEALYQLAEARLHIDRLRFGAHVNIHKHYRVTHSIEDSNEPDHPSTGKRQDCTVRQEEIVKHIGELQERLQSLHDRTQHSEISLDEVQSELMDIHSMHRKLATDLVEMMDQIELESDGEESSDPGNKKMKNELMILAQQLQDFITLLQDKEETILNTTMKRRSSITTSPYDQQNSQDCNVEDAHCTQCCREGWTPRKKGQPSSVQGSSTEIDRGQKGEPQLHESFILTPPYTPIVKELPSEGHQSHLKGINQSTNTTLNNKPPSTIGSRQLKPLSSKIPVYSNKVKTGSLNTNRRRIETVSNESGEVPDSSSDDDETCNKNIEQVSLNCRKDDNMIPVSTHALSSDKKGGHQKVTKCPQKSTLRKERHHNESKEKLSSMQRDLPPTSKSESDITRSIVHCPDCCCHNTKDSTKTTIRNEKGTKRNSPRTEVPTIVIDNCPEERPLHNPTFTSLLPTISNAHTSTCTMPQFDVNFKNCRIDVQEKSIMATPQTSDKGIQVDSTNQMPRTPARIRRKKSHHRTSRGTRHVESYLSSDDSHVLLIDSREFFKRPNYFKRKTRNNKSYKTSGGGGGGERERALEKEGSLYDGSKTSQFRRDYQKRKYRTRRKKPVYYQVIEAGYRAGHESSLESTTKDSLSSSDSTLINTSISTSINNKTSPRYSTSYRPPFGNFYRSNSNGNSTRLQCSERQPHSDTSLPIPLYSSRPIPIPSRSLTSTRRETAKPVFRKESLSLDEAIDLAERLKKSSKRMNAVLNDTFLSQYSV